jgi:hypothetical protein
MFLNLPMGIRAPVTHIPVPVRRPAMAIPACCVSVRLAEILKHFLITTGNPEDNEARYQIPIKHGVTSETTLPSPDSGSA